MNAQVDDESLRQSRKEAADRAFERYDFGQAQVEDANGWEYLSGGAEYTRTIFIANRHGASIRARFSVQFKAQSALITEVYAIDENGQMFGGMSSTDEVSTPTIR
jgi:hypothetical protein